MTTAPVTDPLTDPLTDTVPGTVPGTVSGTVTETTDGLRQGRRDALSERLFGAVIAGAELLTVELGRRLGLYDALGELGSATSAELALRAGIAERYAREWLEQQAAAGILDVVEDTGVARERRFDLPEEHASVLLDAEDQAYMIGAAPMLTGAALTLPAVVEAYRTGTGVAYADFGEEIRHGIASLNRPVFVAELPEWLATMPDVVARLRAGGRVLDAGCGVGWSSITIARAFPGVSVHGVDMDEASVEEARRNAAAHGVSERVTFEAANVAAARPGDEAPYDLVCVFEALHDMGEPVDALSALRSALAPGAPVLVVDERVADTFTAPAEEVERFQYAYSVLHCLPATMDESTAVAHGTILRTPTVRAWAAQAGYTSLEVLPLENDFWRFYRLDA